jgi:hypothetical protein
MVSLILKRGLFSRSSGEWKDEDYDVLTGGKAVGPSTRTRLAVRRRSCAGSGPSPPSCREVLGHSHCLLHCTGSTQACADAMLAGAAYRIPNCAISHPNGPGFPPHLGHECPSGDHLAMLVPD